jgi:hypothetical protein
MAHNSNRDNSSINSRYPTTVAGCHQAPQQFPTNNFPCFNNGKKRAPAPVVNQQRDHQKGLAPWVGCTNYTTVEEIPTGEEVLAGTFSLNEHPVIIMFDSGASHDFISSTCAKKTMLSTVTVEALYVISTPRGRVDADRIVRKAPLELARMSY